MIQWKEYQGVSIATSIKTTRVYTHRVPHARRCNIHGSPFLQKKPRLCVLYLMRTFGGLDHVIFKWREKDDMCYPGSRSRGALGDGDTGSSASALSLACTPAIQINQDPPPHSKTIVVSMTTWSAFPRPCCRPDQTVETRFLTTGGTLSRGVALTLLQIFYLSHTFHPLFYIVYSFHFFLFFSFFSHVSMVSVLIVMLFVFRSRQQFREVYLVTNAAK